MQNYHIDTYVTEVIIIPAVGTVPNNLTVGQTANVNCNAVLNTNIDDNMSSVHKEWYHNEMITDHETIQRSGLQLRLSKVRASFAGYYKCVAWINDNTLTNESNSILLCVTCELYISSNKCYQDIITLETFIVILCYFIPLLLFTLQIQNPNTNCINEYMTIEVMLTSVLFLASFVSTFNGHLQ